MNESIRISVNHKTGFPFEKAMSIANHICNIYEIKCNSFWSKPQKKEWFYEVHKKQHRGNDGHFYAGADCFRIGTAGH